MAKRKGKSPVDEELVGYVSEPTEGTYKPITKRLARAYSEESVKTRSTSKATSKCDLPIARTRTVSSSLLGARARAVSEESTPSLESLALDLLDEPLVGLQRHIADLERRINSDEDLLGIEEEYNPRTPVVRPLLSSTSDNLLDEFNETGSELSAIKIRVSQRLSTDSESSVSSAEETVVIPDLEAVARRAAPSAVELELAARGLSPAPDKWDLLLQRLPDLSSDRSTPVPSGRTSRARTPDEQSYQDLLIAEGLGAYLPTSPILHPAEVLDHSDPTLSQTVSLPGTPTPVEPAVPTPKAPVFVKPAVSAQNLPIVEGACANIPSSTEERPGASVPSPLETERPSATMPDPPAAVAAAVLVYLRCQMKWEDDYHDLDPDAVPMAHLSELAAEAARQKQ